MQPIKRDLYLRRLEDRRGNGLIKVVTGVRRCGKSYLLFKLFREHLIESGVAPSRIIDVALDDVENEALRDRMVLAEYIRQRVSDDGMWFVFLDEIQMCPGFESILNGLDRHGNLDIYVTGSNSKFLSSDILTEFRGRGDEVRVFPLSFSEYLPAHGGDKYDAWLDYCTYGGLPLILSRKTDEMKSGYLMGLCNEVYLKDIVDRNSIRGDSVMSSLLDVLASATGSLTNPTKLADTFNSKGLKVSNKTVSIYIDYLLDAFLINRAQRYDIKGKKYIASPYKYYFTDVGLRNARLNFRQQEENHIMENIIYNELLVRGYNVDVGVVERAQKESDGKVRRRYLEVDFVCNSGSRRYYVQSAFTLPDAEKTEQEIAPLLRTGDSFKKTVIVRDRIKPWRNEQGIIFIDIMDFLLNPDSLDL